VRCVDLGTFLAHQGKMNFTLPPLMLAAGLGMPLNELLEMPRKALMMLAGLFGNTAAPLAYDRCR
jgi:hypothetical protein